MSYADIDKIDLDENCRGLLKKHFDYHVEKVRLMLHDIERFSKASHPIYKRFKHAGMSIFSNAVQKTPPSGPLSIFEVFNLVADGPDPVRDIVIIPYSKHVLKRYEKIIDKLQTLLLEMTENRIICLKRNIPGMIPITYSLDLFSSEEAESMQTTIHNFELIHPIGEVPTNLNYNLNEQDSKKIMDKISWYLKEED